MTAIAAGPHGTAFALGANTGDKSGPVSIQWNGHAWVKAPMPSWATPQTVAFAPGGAAWAGGYYYSGGGNHMLVLRWTGHDWARVASPSTAVQLNGFGFATAAYGWAVGTTNSFTGTSDKTYIAHWNGRTWS